MARLSCMATDIDRMAGAPSVCPGITDKPERPGR